jgi:hypothetical protein
MWPLVSPTHDIVKGLINTCRLGSVSTLTLITTPLLLPLMPLIPPPKCLVVPPCRLAQSMSQSQDVRT